MKPGGTLSNLFSCGLVVAGMVALSSSEAAVNKAVVRAVRGTAQYSLAGAGYKPLQVGYALPPNSKIRTAADSSVDLFLGDNGPVVRVTPDTELGVDKLDVADSGVEKVINTQLDLRNGRILGNVKKMAAASKYEVKTPRGVAGIRGTEYDIRADGTVHVISGTVLMVYMTQGRATPITVNAGQTAHAPTAPGTQPTITTVPPDVTGALADVRDKTAIYVSQPPVTVIDVTTEGQPPRVIPHGDEVLPIRQPTEDIIQRQGSPFNGNNGQGNNNGQ